MDAGTRTWVLWENCQCSYLLSQLSHPVGRLLTTWLWFTARTFQILELSVQFWTAGTHHWPGSSFKEKPRHSSSISLLSPTIWRLFSLHSAPHPKPSRISLCDHLLPCEHPWGEVLCPERHTLLYYFFFLLTLIFNYLKCIFQTGESRKKDGGDKKNISL